MILSSNARKSRQDSYQTADSTFPSRVWVTQRSWHIPKWFAMSHWRPGQEWEDSGNVQSPFKLNTANSEGEEVKKDLLIAILYYWIWKLLPTRRQSLTWISKNMYLK